MNQILIEQLNTLDTTMSSIVYAQNLMEVDNQTLASAKGVEARAHASEYLSTQFFNALINDQVEKLLEGLSEVTSELDELSLAKYHYFKREYDRIAKIPVEEYAKFQGLALKSTSAWEEAKAKNDFKHFAPYLDELIKMQKKFIDYRGYTSHPYNTLLDDYEPGLDVQMVDGFFEALKASIVPLVKKIQEKSPLDISFINQSFDIKGQEEFSKYIMEAIGFRMDEGKLLESEHPFTQSLSPNDVRLTTHYHPNLLNSSISSTIHETGHGLYEQNISPNIGFSLLSSGVSMGIHESQSRLYENNFGRHLNFWKKHYPKLVDIYKDQLKDIPVETFINAFQVVQPSLIRTEADEVTYPLHIMVRYELEKKIFSEEVNVYDLPKLWDDKYEEYVGVRPSSDKEGILQDVHWASALFGYFPSYALGSAYSAQFVHAMEKDFSVDDALLHGDMEKILAWLRTHIHQYGATKSPSLIIKEACKEDFNPKYFIDYLTARYTQVYNL